LRPKGGVLRVGGLGQKYPRIQILSVKEYFEEGKRANYPRKTFHNPSFVPAPLEKPKEKIRTTQVVVELGF